MSVILRVLDDLLYKRRDPRTDGWFLTNPGSLFTICIVYAYFCLSAGPKYMRHKKPYKLRKTLVIYNLVQVVASILLLLEGVRYSWLHNYSLTCQPVDYSDDPYVWRMIRATYFYYLMKLVELLDTVFFVLRKKQRQISPLHMYHHILMTICGWIGVRFLPNGHGTFLGVINTFVHIIMYTYYMISAFGPQFAKYLWWKKYLTVLQIVQFVIVFVHSSQILFNGCPFPKIIALLIMLNSSIFVYLFSSFYANTYGEKSKETSEKRAASNVPGKESPANGVIRDKLE